MNPLVGSALIGAGGSLLGSLFGGKSRDNAQREANETNLRIARETNAQNLQIFHEQQAFNREQYENWLAYNTPLAQRQRYEEAGINPYLAMSNIGSGSAQSALQSPQAPTMQGTQVQPLTGTSEALMNGLGQAAQIFATLSSVQAQNEKTRAETAMTLANLGWLDRLNLANIGKIRSDTDNSNFDFSFKNMNLGNMLAMSDLSLDQGRAMLAQTEAATQGLIIENQVKQFRFDLDKKYSEPMMQQALAQAINSNDEIRARIASINYDTNVYKPGMLANDRQRVSDNHALTIAECNKLVADTIKSYEETSGIKVDNDTKRKVQGFVIDTYHSEAKTASTQAHISWNEAKMSDREQKHYNANNWIKWISSFNPLGVGLAGGAAKAYVSRGRPIHINGFGK